MQATCGPVTSLRHAHRGSRPRGSDRALGVDERRRDPHHGRNSEGGASTTRPLRTSSRGTSTPSRHSGQDLANSIRPQLDPGGSSTAHLKTQAANVGRQVPQTANTDRAQSTKLVRFARACRTTAGREPSPTSWRDGRAQPGLAASRTRAPANEARDVSAADGGVDAAPDRDDGGGVVSRALAVTASRNVDVGGAPVRRALPQRGRRTVGAWCFADHIGPMQTTDHHGLDVGPHPHIGLQTVTWLVSGELLHRDSLGSQQLIRPGQLNLMTAGRGVSHAEESTGHYRGDMHGVQLWIAQPDATRHTAPTFEHYDELLTLDLDGGVATVLIGSLESAKSNARHDTELVGIELALDHRTTVPLREEFEYALLVMEGGLRVDNVALSGGQLGYLRAGRGEVAINVTAFTRAMLIGGTPFEEQILMWWNFVARTHEEVDAAFRSWEQADDRFGTVASSLERITTSSPLWQQNGRS